MESSSEPLALIAGSSQMPSIVAREAQARGHRVTAVAIRGITDEAAAETELRALREQSEQATDDQCEKDGNLRRGVGFKTQRFEHDSLFDLGILFQMEPIYLQIKRATCPICRAFREDVLI